MGLADGATEPLNHCAAGGLLVGAASTIPDEPTEFSPSRVLLADDIGCSNLICRECEEAVTHERPDIPGARLYRCSCHDWLETTRSATAPTELDVGERVPPPWRCAGHPAVTLPCVVDGERITEDTDFDDLVGRVLRGWKPVESPVRTLFEAWLARLYERLAGTPAATQLAEAVGRAIDTREDALVGGALVFFGRYPMAPGFDRVIALVRDRNVDPNRTWNAAYADETLGRLAVDTLAERLRTNHEHFALVEEYCIDVIRARVVEEAGTVTPAALVALAAVDGEWLVQQTDHWVATRPERVPQLVEALAAFDTTLAALSATAAARAGSGPLLSWLDQQDVGARPWVLVVHAAAQTTDAEVR